MQRDEALAVLKTHLPEMKARFGIASLYLFGSTARDEATAASDVDVLVKFAPEACAGLFELYDLKTYLETLLGSDVDVLTAEGFLYRGHAARNLFSEFQTLEAVQSLCKKRNSSLQSKDSQANLIFLAKGVRGDYWRHHPPNPPY